MYQFTGFKAAKEAAIEASKRDKDTSIYIQWVEDDCYCLGTDPDLKGDSYARNGEWLHNEEECDAYNW